MQICPKQMLSKSLIQWRNFAIPASYYIGYSLLLGVGGRRRKQGKHSRRQDGGWPWRGHDLVVSLDAMLAKREIQCILVGINAYIRTAG